VLFRSRDVPILAGRLIAHASAAAGGVSVTLDDGTRCTADHLLLATGYQVDAMRYPFLPAELLRGLQHVGGYPVLSAGMESSIPGLHFLGAPAAHSFGPLMRFVSGSHYAATRLAHAIAPARAPAARATWIPAPPREVELVG
jgi:hypothetical protein